MNKSHNFSNSLDLPIFVISLPGSSRRAKVSEHLDSLGVRFSFFDAFRGRVDLKNPECFRSELSEGEVGCWRSHLGLLQKIIREKIPMALVLEDDILIQDKDLLCRQISLFHELYYGSKIRSHAGFKWHWIKLFQVNKIKALLPVFQQSGVLLSVPFKRGFSSMAYLISEPGAARFLEGYSKNILKTPIYEPIDRYLDNTHRSKVDLLVSDLGAIGESIDTRASQISDRAPELRNKVEKLSDSIGMRAFALRAYIRATVALSVFKK